MYKKLPTKGSKITTAKNINWYLSSLNFDLKISKIENRVNTQGIKIIIRSEKFIWFILMLLISVLFFLRFVGATSLDISRFLQSNRYDYLFL